MTSIRQVLNFMPLRGGLATAGQRSTIDEGQLWGAQNMYPALDGMLSGRPGLVQWGQTLTAPATTASNQFHELFADLNNWDVSTSGNANSTYSVSLGMLTLSMSPNSGTPTASTIQLTRNVADDSTGGDYSLKFMLRMVNPDGSDTTGGHVLLHVSGDSGTTVHEILINANGIYVTESATAVIKYTPTYKLDLGGGHLYEFYYDSGADTMIIGFDGELQDAFSMASADNVGFTGTSNTLEIISTLADTESAWAAYVTDLQYSDMVYAADDPPFVGQYVFDVGQYVRRLSGSYTKSTLLAATGSRLYADIGESGMWRPVTALSPGHTFMLPFQNKMLFFDDNGQNSSRVLVWDGVLPVEQVEDAPPVRFGTVHRTRVWAGGDRNFPLRAYFTDSRRYDVWFAPDYDPEETVDEVLNAGYVEVPSDAGDQLTGLFGEYNNSEIIQTEVGLWVINGSSPLSFQLERLTSRVGGGSPTGMVQIGTDLTGVGKAGVYALSNAQTTGALQMGMPSAAIADKWSSLPAVPDRVDRNQLYHSYAAMLPSLNLVVYGMRGQGQNVLDRLYAYNPLTQSWYGPWTYEPTCFAQAEVGIPSSEVLLHGHSDGKVSITGLNVTEDFGESFTRTFESPMLSGRSIDPGLVHLTKTWKVLRFFVLPRMNQTFTVEFRIDDNDYEEVEYSQDPADGPSLSDDFILDDSLLSSDTDVAVIDVRLDGRGRFFQFKISSDYHIDLQGYQVEFLPGNKED